MKRKSIIAISIILIITLLFANNVYASEIKKGNYSKKYEEWLQLSEEEKEKTIPPLAFNVRNNKKTLVNKFNSLLESYFVPSRYDLREHIDVEVKNQMDTGSCWAFSANSSIETNLAIQNQNYNFSERHLDYDTAKNYVDGTNENALNRKIGAGGYATTAFTYYSRGSGPILEEDMPFENNEYPITISELPQNINVKKVDNMIFFPSIFKYLDENNNIIYTDGNEIEYSKSEVNEIRNEIKTHIMNYGGVTIDIIAPIMYYNEDTHAANVQGKGLVGFANHSVTIIGWDDNYSKDNFIDKPNSDGAYIVLNSWGSDWGENGIYYISYEDMLVESSMRGVTSVSDIEYDNLYQHDVSEMWNYIESKYAANVFSSKENGKLTEVMIGSLSDQTCNIYVSVEENEFNINNRIKVANNVSLKPGYNTISLTSDINITKGKKFAIIVELTNNEFEGIGIEDSTAYFGNVVSNVNESFISENGIDWNDIYDENNMMNLSIKAYTQDEEKAFKLVDIKGQVYENFGGQISMKIDTSYIEEGSPIEINIFNDEENVTNMFNITNNKVKGKGAFIKIECPTNIEHGTYNIRANLKDYNEINAEFTVQEVPEDFITITFNDENLYKNIQMVMKNYIKNNSNLQITISRSEIESIEELELAYLDISNLQGIENFVNLKKLDLSNNNIQDITPLSQLNNIEYLDLSSNHSLVSLNAISNYKKISELYLQYNTNLITIKDDEGFIIDLNEETIDIITNLKTLTVLDIRDTGIKNIDWTVQLNNLTSLFLGGNSSIDDFNILESLVNVEELDLSCTGIDNLELLKDLTNLKKLSLAGNNIENINFLENLKDLTYLDLGSNNIEDISIISQLNNLKYLMLGHNNIPNIEVFEGFSEFEYLGLEYNNITDISPLKNIIGFGCLELSGNHIEDVSDLPVSSSEKWLYPFRVLRENTIYKEVTIENNQEVLIELPQIMKVIINLDYDYSDLYCNSRYILKDCRLSEDRNSIIIDPTKSMTASIIIEAGNADGSSFNVTLKQKPEKQVSEIEIVNPPNKVRYVNGENFDATGMIVVVKYDDDSVEEISDYVITNGANLRTGQTSVIISYTKGETTVTAEQEITVVNGDIVFNDLEVFEKDNVYYVKISPLFTIEELTSKMNQEFLLNNTPIYEDLTEDGKLKTGSKILFQGKEKYTIIVKGDTNCDGRADLKDLLQINKHRLGKVLLDGEYLMAGDINQDEQVDLKDLLKLNKYRLGKIDSL